MDMSTTVAPKSDQLNSDDLISGPITIKITKVSGTGNADQPVAVYFEGDNGKPFKPCKSMRRVMITAWGADAAEYAGRSMTLYRDPKVAFGGMEVGGTRISHMSDIAKDLTMALTVTKAKRAPYSVKVLVARSAEPIPAPLTMLAPDLTPRQMPTIERWEERCKEAIAKIPDAANLVAWRTAMGPHFLAAEHTSRDAVDHVQGVAQDRLDALAEAMHQDGGDA